jgi:outer membrane protein assembly factor BamB
VASAPAAPGNVWSMLAHDAQHSGVNPTETGKPPATPVWEWPSGVTNPWMHGIAVEDNRVFAASKSQFSPVMTALDASTGAVLWSQTFSTGSEQYGPPSVANGRVYWSWFNNPSSKFVCAEAVTGRVLWGTGLLADGFYGPTQAVLANDAAYVTGGVSSMGWLSTFNSDDGRLGWINPSGYLPSVQGTSVYLHWQDTFRSLDPATGNALWTTAMPVGSVPAVTATRGYGVTNRDLFAINLTTHAVVGTVASGNLNNFYTEPAVSGGNLYWISDGALQVRRESDLKLMWSFAGDGELRSRPVIANGYLYLSSLNNTYILRISTHAVAATIPVGGTPAVAAGKLFISGLDGTLRAYQLH